jgi:radical SAM-linked protein
VLRRAWELGAGMDAWFDNVETAFTAWGTAIAQAGLDWKYRQVENGEWNLFALSNKEQETISPLDIPLPWDHIDTGIDKKWLQDDLKRALEAATIPDCSFAGCSHCGVCGTDFGHNIVIEPPPIPNFAGDFVPNTTKTQRLRVWFGKQGDMSLVSHLDLMRLFDRVIRRAGLPITFTGGFHPGPRISLASALALGATSSGEIADFEFTQTIDVETFHTQLVDQLPTDIPVYNVVEIDIKSPSANQSLEAAEYLLTVSISQTEVQLTQWQSWIETITHREEILSSHTTKSGKQELINLRDRLWEIELISASSGESDSTAVLRYLGSCRPNGVILRPEQILSMLAIVANQEFHLLHIHRSRLVIA